MIQLIIDTCNCCNIPADQCEIVTGFINRGVPPDLITHEVLTPELMENDRNVSTGIADSQLVP